MKRLLFLASVLMLLSSAVFGQQQTPTMTFTKVKHDFGNIKQEDGPASVVFEFTNTGGEPIIITNVKSSCGCTTPTWTRQPVAPGTKGTIEAVYNPVNRPGHFNKTITVTSNASNSPITLTITGNVLEQQNTVAQSYPQEVGKLKIDKIYLNFGNMNNDEEKTMTFEIYNPTASDVTVAVENRYKPAYTEVTVEPTVLKPNSAGTITVKYNASQVNDWDYVRGFIYLTIDGQAVRNKRLQISAVIKEKFTAAQMQNPPVIEFNETTFAFDTINEGDIIEHVFTFKNTGKSDLIIRKTRSSCGCTVVNMNTDPVPPGETGQIKATFNSTHKRNRQVKTITVISNCPDPQYNKVVLRLEGYVIPAQ